MRVGTLVVFSLLGMVSTCLLVSWLTPISIAAAAQPTPRTDRAATPSRVEMPGLVDLDARVAHSALFTGGDRTTYLLLRAHAPERAQRSQPIAMVILIDRSGSMRGSRLTHALAAARGMIERLSDGDRVTVMTYDTRVSELVPATHIDAHSKGAAVAKLDAVAASGNTCISCALSAGISDLEGVAGIKEILLLSDGEANTGVRKLDGFERIAHRARTAGVDISSIGVDVDYNELLLSTLARLSNGRHHFVRDPADLLRAFKTELSALGGAVATDAALGVKLARHVQLLRVFDREVRHKGRDVTARLGTFSAGDTKTLLLRVALPKADPGDHPVATIRFDYKVGGSTRSVTGSVGTRMVAEQTEQAPLDATVVARLARSRAGALLFDSGKLFDSGDSADFAKLDRRFGSELARLGQLQKGADPRLGAQLSAEKAALSSARHRLRAARAGRCGCAAGDLQCALRCSAPKRHHAPRCAPGDPICTDLDGISSDEKAASKSSVAASNPFRL